LHFVEVTSQKPMPIPYEKDNPWSSILWLDPKDVFSLLFFDQPNISDGLKQVRDWFLGRLTEHSCSLLEGAWSHKMRKIAIQEISELTEKYSINNGVSNELYDEQFKI
jgi:hypothetical protein